MRHGEGNGLAGRRAAASDRHAVLDLIPHCGVRIHGVSSGQCVPHTAFACSGTAFVQKKNACDLFFRNNLLGSRTWLPTNQKTKQKRRPASHVHVDCPTLLKKFLIAPRLVSFFLDASESST